MSGRVSRPSRNNVRTDADGEELDPRAATSQEELAELLRRLHIRAGEPSLRGLENWARKQQKEGRPNIHLTRNTISEVLTGKRLPSHEFLVAFLEACQIVGDAQQPWLVARAKIVEQQRGLNSGPAAPVQQEQPRKGPENDGLLPGPEPNQRTTDPGRGVLASGVLGWASSPVGKRWLFSGTAAVLVGFVIGFVASRQEHPVKTTMSCVPEGCAAAAKELTVNGHLSGELPPHREVYIVSRVESTKRWYLGPTVVPDSDGNWSHRIGIGNPVPQRKDRHFTICTFIMPTSSMDELTQLFASYHGAGLSTEELPEDRTQLMCIPAVRLANS